MKLRIPRRIKVEDESSEDSDNESIPSVSTQPNFDNPIAQEQQEEVGMSVSSSKTTVATVVSLLLL